jgi:hypothetical protein
MFRENGSIIPEHVHSRYELLVVGEFVEMRVEYSENGVEGNGVDHVVHQNSTPLYCEGDQLLEVQVKLVCETLFLSWIGEKGDLEGCARSQVKAGPTIHQRIGQALPHHTVGTTKLDANPSEHEKKGLQVIRIALDDV